MVMEEMRTASGFAGFSGDERCRVTLGRLWERYHCECETFRDTDQTHRSDTATRAAILIAYFGADYDVERLSTDSQRRYERARAAGGLRHRHERRVVRFGRVHVDTVVHVSQPTRARSAEADLVLLHAMLNWATTVRDPSAASGTRSLGVNPLKGIGRRPEKNPRRPVTCQERFDATRRAIQRRSAQAPDGSAERHKWIRLELALVLAEATGRRIGAIRQLRWEDIDYAAPAITWRADADKMGVLWTIDLSPPLVAELRRFQARLGTVGGWVFPAARFPDQPTDRWAMVKCLLQAERDAGLQKLVGGVWHPYRRKWRWNERTGPCAMSLQSAAGKAFGVFSSAMRRPIARLCAPSSTSHGKCCRRTCSRRSSRRGSPGRLRLGDRTRDARRRETGIDVRRGAVSRPPSAAGEARERK